MRREPVEVVIARNGTLGPLHFAIPIGGDRYAAACKAGNRRRILAGDRVHVWTRHTGGTVWGEVRTCPDCERLGDRVESTIELAVLAGWTPPAVGAATSPRRASRPRH